MSALVPPILSDRFKAAIRAFIRAEDPNRSYRAIYAYVVQATDGKTVDASPADTTGTFGPLRSVPILTGIGGAAVTPAIGSTCGIGFLNGDPTRPFVLGVFDGAAAKAVSFNGGIAAARGGMTQVPSGPPWTGAVIPKGDPVLLAFTALDPSGNVANTGTFPSMSPPPSLWDGMTATTKSYYPATLVGFAEALAASASLTPSPGQGVGAIFGFISSGSSVVTIGG